MKHYVSIYYDETTLEHVNLHGHALLFVPDVIECDEIHGLFDLPSEAYYPKQTLLKHIGRIRSNGCHTHKFHFSKLSGKKLNQSDRANLELASLLADGLLPIRSPSFPNSPNIKAAVMYYPVDADFEMYGGDAPKEQRLRLDETILRMLLKGACHYFYDKMNEVIIKSLYIDGDPKYRNLDLNRIVNRLFNEEQHGRSVLRDYVTFDPKFDIVHLDSNHNIYSFGTDSYGHANLLQCVDLVLGSINYAVYPPNISLSHKKNLISEPLRSLIYKGNSSIKVSNISFSDGKVAFEKVNRFMLEEEILNRSIKPLFK